MELTEFEQHVLQCIQRIPAGRVATYRQVAEAIGKPGAARAVGNALHKNPWAPVVPCHRVVASAGRLGGYAGGSRRKRQLLSGEGVDIRNNAVDLAQFGFTL